MIMSKLSFNEVAERWKSDKRKYVKNSTYAVYAQLCNHYVVPFFSGRRPAEGDVQRFADSMLARGLAVKTVKDSVLVLRMILKYGAALRCWPNIGSAVRFPTTAAGPGRPLTLPLPSRKRLVSYLAGHVSRPNLAILICMQSGIRIGEACGLQWKDLDCSAGVIHVCKTVQRIYLADGELHAYFLSVDVPKTQSSIRDIPMTSQVRTIVRQMRAGAVPEHFVLSDSDVPWEPRRLRSHFNRLLLELGIPPVRFHALRHSFATACIASGCDYKTVSAILGHSSVSTTMDLYVHPDLEDKKRCIEKMCRTMK